MASLKTIELAISEIAAKKQSLKTAFDNLQSLNHYSSSSLLSLSWCDLDSHFSAIQNHLSLSFQSLQNDTLSSRVDPTPSNPGLPKINGKLDLTRIQPNPNPPPEPEPGQNPDAGESPDPEPSHDGDDGVDSVAEMVAFCERMDGVGLRDYLMERRKERESTRVGLIEAMRVAPDPGKLVLDAVEGFDLNNNNNKEFIGLRKSCLELLEGIVEIGPGLSDDVRERARRMAVEWKGKVGPKGGENNESPLGLLNLVVGFGLLDLFGEEKGELVEYFYAVARYRHAAALCKAVDLGEKANADLVQRLIDNGKRIFAVKFILECGMSDKFQPVPLLKAHLKECKNNANKVCKDGKSSIKQQIEAISREINALRTVIQVIKDYKLESEYPWVELEKRVEILEKQKMDKKNSLTSSDNRPQQQQKQPLKQQKRQQQQPAKQQSKKQKHKLKPQPQPQLNGNKRARTGGPAGPAEVTGSGLIIPPFHQSHSQLAPRSFGLVGSAPPIAPYAGSSVGPYGLAGPAVGYYGNPNPAAVTHSYAHDSYVPSGYYDGQAGYGGYSLQPQYHPAYYPQ